MSADAMPAPPIAVGLCSVTFRQLPPDEVVAVAAGAGVTDLEWGADVHVPPGTDPGALVRRCADVGLTISSYGSYLVAGALDAPPAPKGDIDANLSTAAALGAANVRVWARGDGAADDLADVCTAAADLGLTVSVEYHPGTLTETPAGALALLAAVDAPNLRTYWQPDPSLDAGAQLGDLDAVLAHLSHLHVFSWRPDRARLPLAAGEALWPAALARAVAAPTAPGGRRVAFLEFVRDDDPAALVDDAATLRRWIEQVAA